MLQEVVETFGYGPLVVMLVGMGLAPGWWGRRRVRVVVLVWVCVWVVVMGWLLMRAGYLDMRHTLPLQLVLHGMLGLAVGVWWRVGRRFRERWVGAAVMVAVVAVCVLPGAVRVAERPLVGRRFVREAADWIRVNTPADTLVLDKERLIGYYSRRPYGYWAGDPNDREHPVDTLLYQIDQRRTKQTPHVIFGLIYSPKRGQAIPGQLGGFREVARFASSAALGGDTMVLYAAPWDEVVKTVKK
jgi:hypothetical protein